MKTGTKQIKEVLQGQQFILHREEHIFVTKHVPRFHQMMIQLFPWTKKLYAYAIARHEDDPSKLTLFRGRKIIAKNFDD